MPQWVDFLGGSWSHLQGGISAILALLKPDIKDAFLKFLTCGCFIEEEYCGENRTRPSSSRISASSGGVRSSYWWPREQSNHSSFVSSYVSSVGGSSVDLQDGVRPDSTADDIEEDTSYYFNEKSDGEMVTGITTASNHGSLQFQIRAEGSSRELCAAMGDHVISLKE